MIRLYFITFFIPLWLCGQSTYSGYFGKYRHGWTLGINSDSSVVLIKTIQHNGYEERRGKLKRLNDTLFRITASLVYAQVPCRAVGDSVLYLRVDTALAQTLKYLTLAYAGKEKTVVAIEGKRRLNIPLHKKADQPNPGQAFFEVSAGHIHPLTLQEVKTLYRRGDEYGLELYTQQEPDVYVVIKKGKLRKIGRDHLDHFILTKTAS